MFACKSRPLDPRDCVFGVIFGWISSGEAYGVADPETHPRAQLWARVSSQWESGCLLVRVSFMTDQDRDLKISSPLFAKRISGRVGPGRTSRLSQHSSEWSNFLLCDTISDCKLCPHIIKVSGCSRSPKSPSIFRDFSKDCDDLLYQIEQEVHEFDFYIYINQCLRLSSNIKQSLCWWDWRLIRVTRQALDSSFIFDNNDKTWSWNFWSARKYSCGRQREYVRLEVAGLWLQRKGLFSFCYEKCNAEKVKTTILCFSVSMCSDDLSSGSTLFLIPARLLLIIITQKSISPRLAVLALPVS